MNKPKSSNMVVPVKHVMLARPAPRRAGVRFLYEEFARLAETRLTRNTLNCVAIT